MGLKAAEGGDMHARSESERSAMLGVERQKISDKRDANKPVQVDKNNKPTKQEKSGGKMNKW